MKIYSTWSDDFDAFEHFFEGHDVQPLPEDFKGLEMDLLIFPGGHDVHPERYGGEIPNNSPYAGWIDEVRDAYESRVFQYMMTGMLKTKKTLAVCRGMQAVNVFLGGALYYDIGTRFGRTHPYTHKVVWQVPTIFSNILTVNSTHHQGLRRMGDNIRPRILAIEPGTSIPEAVLWGDSILGMQFHPELWGDETEMKVFSKGIIDWVEGKSSITTGEEVSEPRLKTKARYSWDTPPEPASFKIPEWMEQNEEEEEIPDDDQYSDDEEPEEEE
jgi:putative glutamine amidotransferase